jgi:enamine deaminase RidA (YjgF/YER057c/UK114 family)
MFVSNALKRSRIKLTSHRGFASPVCSIEEKINALGLHLPAPAVSKDAFQQFSQVGDIAYLSGHLPQPKDKALVTGKVGKELTADDGYEAAKLCGLNLCATLKANLGSLTRVKKIIKLTGFVNATSSFTDHPKVINGCSELFTKVFPEDISGHSRSAIGNNGLPMGVPVEIEMIVQVHPPPEPKPAPTATAE